MYRKDDLLDLELQEAWIDGEALDELETYDKKGFGKISEDVIEHMIERLEDDGFQEDEPILLMENEEGNFEIIDGKKRVLAALELDIAVYAFILSLEDCEDFGPGRKASRRDIQNFSKAVIDAQFEDE